tara:strand:+ start:974 stop:1120 length:147 start_codon:yes stop_codon:yes gene_type:complete
MKITAALLAITALLYVSEADYQQAEQDAEHYCEMVRDGTWPNFDEREC